MIRFTTALWRLEVGHRMRMIGPKGKFMLEPDDARTHLYVSTGTGIAPFISMIRETMAPRRSRAGRSCSTAARSSPSSATARSSRPGHADPRYRLTYIPTISRPNDPRNDGWSGKVGRAEQIVMDVCREQGLKPDRTVVYICGNPEMILNVERQLMDREFPEFHVKKELYWPKGKAPAPAG